MLWNRQPVSRRRQHDCDWFNTVQCHAQSTCLFLRLALVLCCIGIRTLYIPYSYWGHTVRRGVPVYSRASSCVAALTREWSVLLQCLPVACTQTTVVLRCWSTLILIKSLMNDF